MIFKPSICRLLFCLTEEVPSWTLPLYFFLTPTIDQVAAVSQESELLETSITRWIEGLRRTSCTPGLLLEFLYVIDDRSSGYFWQRLAP